MYSNELIRLAASVLNDIVIRTQKPSAETEATLRAAVPYLPKDARLDDVACEIIQRSLEIRKQDRAKQAGAE